jgi:hypothetical protein
MPKHEGPDLLEDRDIPKYDYISFMEKMMDYGSDETRSGNDNQKYTHVNGGVK